MKQKIKKALQQAYEGLGLGEEAFERAAAFGATFIKEDAEIDNFVKGVEPMLKGYQSDADKVRGKYSQKVKDLEAQIDELKKKSTPKDSDTTKPKDDDTAQADIAKIVAEAVAAAVNPLSEKLTAYEAERSSENAVKTFKQNIETDYVNSYSDFKQEAIKYALKLYERGGKKSTAKEIEDDFFEMFNDKVTNKGGKVGEPIGSDGKADKEPDLDATERMLRNSGKLPKESK